MDSRIHITTDIPWMDMLESADFAAVVAVISITVLLVVIAGGVMTIAFAKAVRGGGATQRQRRQDSGEAQLFQDLQRGFRRMQERIESLETLFLGHAQTEPYEREYE